MDYGLSNGMLTLMDGPELDQRTMSPDMFANILAGQLMPFHEALKVMQESIVCLTNAVHAMEGLDAADGEGHGTGTALANGRAFINAPQPADQKENPPAESVLTEGTGGPPSQQDQQDDTLIEDNFNFGVGSQGSHGLRHEHQDAHYQSPGPPSPGGPGQSLDVRAIARGGSMHVPAAGAPRSLSERMGQKCVNCCAFVKRHMVEPERKGRLNTLVSSSHFQNLSSGIICINALFVAHTSDWEMKNLNEPSPMFQTVCENVFFSCYMIELILRLMNHRFYYFINKDMNWNIFDFVLVMLSLFDVVMALVSSPEGEGGSSGGGNISFMRIFRLLKLAKILRTLRVMKVFRDLAQILESFKNCAISLFWSFIMIVFVIYIFALIFLQGLTGYLMDNYGQVSDTQVEEINSSFGSLYTSMVSLYMAVTGGNDWGYYLDLVKKAGVFYELLFLMFTFFFVFALLNILTGVFVEKAVVAAQPDREEIILEQRRKTMEDAHEFKHLCHLLDTDHTGTISKAEFMQSMKNELLTSYMAAVGIEVRDVSLFFDMIGISQDDGEEITIERFVDGCMAMKGLATNFDMQKLIAHVEELKCGFKRECADLSKCIKSITESMDRVDRHICARNTDRANSARLLKVASARAEGACEHLYARAKSTFADVRGLSANAGSSHSGNAAIDGRSAYLCKANL